MLTDEEITRSIKLHEGLVAWLRTHHTHEDIVVVVTALTYEIGRLVGMANEDSPPDDIERSLQSVVNAMRHHVLMYQRGMRH